LVRGSFVFKPGKKEELKGPVNRKDATQSTAQKEGGWLCPAWCSGKQKKRAQMG